MPARRGAAYFDTWQAADEEVHRLFLTLVREQQLLEAAQRAGGRRVTRSPQFLAISLIYERYKDGLNALAVTAAKDFDKAARVNFDATVVRRQRVTAPFLRDLIRSRALNPVPEIPVGLVGLARIATLERAINPNTGYGTYWRAQEYGTGGSVPSQVGRTLRGFFYGPGLVDPQRPQGKFSGVPNPSHPIFVSGGRRAGGLRGGKGGRGVIRHEIRPRLFLTRAADSVFVEYAARARALERETIRSLSTVTP